MTSFLASILLGDDDDQTDEPSLQDEMKALRQENAAMREQLDIVIKVVTQKRQEEDWGTALSPATLNGPAGINPKSAIRNPKS